MRWLFATREQRMLLPWNELFSVNDNVYKNHNYFRTGFEFVEKPLPPLCHFIHFIYKFNKPCLDFVNKQPWDFHFNEYQY
jgi:hypothetical protein